MSVVCVWRDEVVVLTGQDGGGAAAAGTVDAPFSEILISKVIKLGGDEPTTATHKEGEREK